MNNNNPSIKSKPNWILILIIFFSLNVLFLNCDEPPIQFQESDSSALKKLNESQIEIDYGNEFTTQRKVHLSISSHSAVKMYISNEAHCQTGGRWEKYKESRNWVLNTKNENKKNSLYITFQDQRGRKSPCLKDDIIYDAAPPVISSTELHIDQDSKEITLSYFIIEDTSGIQEVLCTVNQKVQACSEDSLSFIGESGSHIAQIIVTDKAGNESDVFKKLWSADFEAPTTQITLTPPNPSSGSNLTFEFIGRDKQSPIERLKYKCLLRESSTFDPMAEGVDCSSPYNINQQPEGSYTFQVLTIDEYGNRSTPSSYSWDVIQLNTHISFTNKPKPLTNLTTATFSFQAEDTIGPLSDLECQLNQSAFTSCSSGQRIYNQLQDRKNTFSVRVRDRDGNWDHPRTYSWEVDTLAPSLYLSQYPDALSRESQPILSWILDEQDSIYSYTCLLNGVTANNSECSRTIFMPQQDLDDGPYIFIIRVQDGAGNTNSDSHEWIIDTSPPVPVINEGPVGNIESSQATFTFNLQLPERHVQYYCRIDNEKTEPCTSPKTYLNLEHGNHIFYLSATDEVGNTSTEISSSWGIDLWGPEIQVSRSPSVQLVLRDSPITINIDVKDWPSGLSSILCGFEGNLTPCQANEERNLGTSLNPGSYKFIVQATDNLNHTNTQSISWEVSRNSSYNMRVCDHIIGNEDDISEPANTGDNHEEIRRVTFLNWSQAPEEDLFIREKGVYIKCNANQGSSSSINELPLSSLTNWPRGFVTCEYRVNTDSSEETTLAAYIGNTIPFSDSSPIVQTSEVIRNTLDNKEIAFVGLESPENCPHYYLSLRWMPSEYDAPPRSSYPRNIVNDPLLGYSPHGFHLGFGRCCN